MKRPHDQGNMKVSLKFGAHSSRGWVYSHHGRSMAGGRQACCGREQWLRAYMWRHWDRVRGNWEWGELFKTKAHPSPTRPQLILPKCSPTVGQTFRHTSLGGLFLTAPRWSSYLAAILLRTDTNHVWSVLRRPWASACTQCVFVQHMAVTVLSQGFQNCVWNGAGWLLAIGQSQWGQHRAAGTEDVSSVLTQWK